MPSNGIEYSCHTKVVELVEPFTCSPQGVHILHHIIQLVLVTLEEVKNAHAQAHTHTLTPTHMHARTNTHTHLCILPG